MKNAKSLAGLHTHTHTHTDNLDAIKVALFSVANNSKLKANKLVQTQAY